MAEETAFKHNKPKYNVVVTDTPKFDLPSYISNYRGRTVFRRLYLIASCAIALREEAARLAVAEAKRNPDVHNYHDALELLQSITGNKDGKDAEDNIWVAQQEKKNAAESKRLENELKQYKNNLIRESIRMGNEDLGSHYHSIGDTGSAVKAYSRMRDYCTTPSHIASTAFRMISVAIEQRNWLAVQSQGSRLSNIQMKPEETARNAPKINAALGLTHMALGDYKEAAMDFLRVDPVIGDTFNEVLSSNDIAVYGGLCAMASMSRSELQRQVLESNTFRSFLELEPHIRRAISSFCTSKYSQCLEILESYRSDYLLDIYLQDSLPLLYHKIRTKSIVQYFQPFSRVTLSSMEKMFGPPPSDSPHLATPSIINGATNGAAAALPNVTPFQSELIDLISSGRLQARIDLEQNVLIAYTEPPRAALQSKALKTIDSFIREAHLKLIRLNALNGGLEVRAPLSKKLKGHESGGGILDMIDAAEGSAASVYSNGNFGGRGHSLRSGSGS